MNLKDIEHKTELIHKAIKDGVKTLEQYDYWLNGYIIGYQTRQDQVTKGMKS